MMIKVNDKVINTIIIVIMVGCLAFLLIYYFQDRAGECTKNPLAYASQMLEEETGYAFIGTGFFLTPPEVESVTITFNSTGSEVFYG